MARADLLEQHAAACAELAGLYRERATTRAAEIGQRANLFRQLNDGSRNITTIRAEVDAHAADHTVSLIELDGDIDATLALLRGIEMQIAEGPR